MSSRTRLALALCVAFAGAGLWSSPAYAQSAISGVVKDESGAVMPGVSVEAASEALIEKVRTAVTDENGAYRMIDLRPGNYKLTFTLQGFNVVIRELELPSNFVATINADLTVGTLQESVTVSGQSPLVDVQSNVKQQVLTRDVLDAVPTAAHHPGARPAGARRDLRPARRGRLARHAADLLLRPRHRLGPDRGHGRRPDDQRPDGRRRGQRLPQRGDDPGSGLHDLGRQRRDDDRRRQPQPGAQGRRQPLHRRLQVRQEPGVVAGRQPDRRAEVLQRPVRRPGRRTSTSSTSSSAARSCATSCGSSAPTARPTTTSRSQHLRPAGRRPPPVGFAACLRPAVAASRACRPRRWTTRSAA